MSQLIHPATPSSVSTPSLQVAIPGLPPDTYTVLAVASARIYHAQLNTKIPDWCYSRMRGTLVFGKDTRATGRLENGPESHSTAESASHWFRLLDVVSGKPTWMFKVPEGFVYELDRPFFHAFQGMSRRFGFLFEDDDEASVLAMKVQSHTCLPQPVKNRSMSLSIRGKSPSPTTRGTIFPYMVSLPTPNSFIHVAHVGLNKDGVIEASQGIDPSWKAVLEGHGVNRPKTRPTSEVEQVPFGDGFWRSLDARKVDNRIGIKSQAAQDKRPQLANVRRRMPAPSFTVF